MSANFPIQKTTTIHYSLCRRKLRKEIIPVGQHFKNLIIFGYCVKLKLKEIKDVSFGGYLFSMSSRGNGNQLFLYCYSLPMKGFILQGGLLYLFPDKGRIRFVQTSYFYFLIKTSFFLWLHSIPNLSINFTDDI